MNRSATFEAACHHAQCIAHGLNVEVSLMLIDKDILYFRRFAKYVAAIWGMADSLQGRGRLSYY
ncbi:hypothetical protein F3J40_20710 [Pantoea sp. Acro-835]|uniref:Uncharacterized protein n=1 Tax=Candidatus Pantoea multigeneris TaxID=2608357 RepID=A0ABX0RKR4_9GAMM|nr:hypothetical protein [Pantoea multigeneris]